MFPSSIHRNLLQVPRTPAEKGATTHTLCLQPLGQILMLVADAAPEVERGWLIATQMGVGPGPVSPSKWIPPTMFCHVVLAFKIQRSHTLPSKKPAVRRIFGERTPMNVVDVVAVLPFFLFLALQSVGRAIGAAREKAKPGSCKHRGLRMVVSLPTI